MLQAIAADHDLSLNHGEGFRGASLPSFILVNLVIHLANVRCNLQIADDFTELGNVLNNEVDNAQSHYVSG